MVSFETFFTIVHETATRKGLGGPGSGARRQNLTADLGQFWSQNEALVRSWSRAEAREWAESNVSP